MQSFESGIDARVVKTRQVLRDATLELAATSPIESIAVSDICRVAGVNRATFYRHASSPVEILASILLEDLDNLRGVFIDQVAGHENSMIEIWQSITNQTITHVRRFYAVYKVGLTSASNGALENLFRQHVEQSMKQLFASQVELLPRSKDLDIEFLANALPASLAAGLTAVLRSWVNAEDASDSAYLNAVLLSLPTWMLGTESTNENTSRPKVVEDKQTQEKQK